MSYRLYFTYGITGLILLLTGCANPIVSRMTVTETQFLPCPETIPEPIKACPDWPIGAKTLREMAELREEQKKVSLTCRRSYQEVWENHQFCLNSIKNTK